ncbi:MAG: hypothetical protein JW973_18660 [Bacteroidales bacterium]|nr:hypothetical protein [Bacteroidales bacterium]
MKTLQKLLSFMTALCLTLSFSGCNKLKAPRMITQPVKADLIGNYIYVGPDTLPNPKCSGPLSLWRALVDAKGTMTPLGDITVHFDFCGDSLCNYGNLFAYIIDVDGDTLFIDGSGRVLEGRLDEHPVYVTSYWRDTIKIRGGTGKFKGAAGEMLTNDYNSSQDPNSHHHWTGTITLVKGKK